MVCRLSFACAVLACVLRLFCVLCLFVLIGLFGLFEFVCVGWLVWFVRLDRCVVVCFGLRWLICVDWLV